jgi:hypothetical protein
MNRNLEFEKQFDKTLWSEKTQMTAGAVMISTRIGTSLTTLSYYFDFH